VVFADRLLGDITFIVGFVLAFGLSVVRRPALARRATVR
jgi:hypothetical protein